jgi:hypothetical protein
MTRTWSGEPSPTLHKLNFFISDSRTTSSIDYTAILNDNPPAVFIPTTFIYQYGVNPTIGGSICSPTSVAMILRSYNINVDPYQFALSTKDPYFNIFGIWPRVVQNASEFGHLDGAVTRYRTWSEAREVLANGGRIAISVGLPLYSGHLMMLAGFNSSGTPIIHDPAQSNGYSYVFNETQLAQSWFGKGGVAYTFYPQDSTLVNVKETDQLIAEGFELHQNYPNPFNPSTLLSFNISTAEKVTLKVIDILGRDVATLINEELSPGYYEKEFHGHNLPSGIYIYTLQAGTFISTRKMILTK